MSRASYNGPVQGSGPSMLPTLMESDKIFVETLRPCRESDILEKVTIGNVVVFIVYVKDGDGYPKVMCKRLVGLPGDAVQNSQHRTLVVPKGCFWAVGDNLKESYDSRHFGAVSAQNLKGKALYAISQGGILRDLESLDSLT